MGDAGRQLTQAGHLLALNELRLGSAQVGEGALQLAGALLHLRFERLVLGGQQGLFLLLLRQGLSREALHLAQLHLQQLRVQGELPGQEQGDGQRRRQENEGEREIAHQQRQVHPARPHGH